MKEISLGLLLLVVAGIGTWMVMSLIYRLSDTQEELMIDFQVEILSSTPTVSQRVVEGRLSGTVHSVPSVTIKLQDGSVETVINSLLDIGCLTVGSVATATAVIGKSDHKLKRVIYVQCGIRP